MPKQRQCNKYDVNNDIAIGYASNGGIFIIDTEDLEEIRHYTWAVDFEGYIYTAIYDCRMKKMRSVKLHRMLLGLKLHDNKIVDHINRERNDNRRSNLRLVGNRENAINRSLSTRNTSGVIGIFYREKQQKSPWVSTVWINGKQCQRSFKTKEEAITDRKERANEVYKNIRFEG